MCYPVCGMIHIKDPLLLIGKSSPCCDLSLDRSTIWTNRAVSRYSQCFMTGVTKSVVCAILSVGWCI